MSTISTFRMGKEYKLTDIYPIEMYTREISQRHTDLLMPQSIVDLILFFYVEPIFSPNINIIGFTCHGIEDFSQSSDNINDQSLNLQLLPTNNWRTDTNDVDVSSDSDDYSNTDTDDDDTDSTTDSTTSSWTQDTDPNIDLTQYGVLLEQPTPPVPTFDSIVFDATQSLKLEQDTILYPPPSRFYSLDLLIIEDYEHLKDIKFVEWIKSYNYSDVLHIGNLKNINMHQIFLLNNVEDKYHFLIDSVFKHFANDKYKHMLTDMDRENYGLYVLFESLLYSLGRLSSQLLSNSQIQSEFYFYLEHTKNIFPKFISHLNLLENIYKAHIDEHSINLCIEKFAQIYQQNKDESEISLFELSVKALVALDLILRNYSPLTYSILSEKETFDIQDVNTLNNLNINENRIKLLRTSLKYFRGFSLLRALLCLIISDSVLYEEAEKYLFEALYCLKKITSNSLMKIELTRLLLMRYVVVLIENNKNKYVIAVNGCLQQTPQYDNYLYLQTMVILSQRISTMHLKLSNFSESELVLQHRIKQILLNMFSYKSYNINMISIGQIFEISNSATRICFGSLIFHLSKVYIHDGKHCALGIKMLQYLRKYIHVINTTHLSFELARGYYKNGRYKIADNIMEKEVFIRNNKCFSLEFIQLRVLIMINCKRFGDALNVLKDAIEQMFTKEQKAILHYLQGKVLQSQCFEQLRVIYEDTQNNNVAIYKQVTDPLQAQKAFLISNQDIRNVHRKDSIC
eukprot:104344_1